MAKKKVETSDENLSKAIDLHNLFTKTYGKTILEDGNTIIEDTSMLSTGSLRLDIALRRPVPVGVHELAGGYACGKSTMALHMIERAQKKGWPTYYLDLERGLTKEFIERFTVDLSKFYRVKPSSAEEACDITLEILRNIENPLIVIDSMHGLSATEATLAKTMSEQTMGEVAKLLSKFLSKAIIYADNARGRVILINQKRDNLKPYGGRVTPGGNSVEHCPHQRLWFSGGNAKADLIKQGDKVIGKNVSVEVGKNRCGSPGIVVSVPILFKSGIWRESEVLSLATEFGVIQKAASYYSYGGSTVAQGEVNAIQWLLGTPGMYDEVEKAVLSMTGMNDEI